MFAFIKKILGTAQSRLVGKYFKQVKKINEWEKQYQSLSDDELRGKTKEFQQRLEKGESLDDLLPEAFAVVKNVCRRLCGTEVHVSGYDQRWDMVPYDVQLVGGISLHNGNISEMQTGEGKTLTAVLPLYLNALSGKPVHLVTVNDYLAQRDCDWVGSVLRWLGLTTAALTNDTPIEQRKNIYEADVVYGTSSEFGFDYLRDNSMATRKEQQVQRGYFFAIIDEVDSVLIDEARTPLIISGPAPESRQMYDELKSGVDALVKLQRDYCNRLASDAWKSLKDVNEGDTLSEEQKEQLRKLWLVGKGTPRNKILKRAKENPDLRAGLDQWDLYYYADQNKQERADALAELYITIDEKSSEYELTDKGIAAWADCVGDSHAGDDFVMLDISDEFLNIDENPNLSDEEKLQKRLDVQEEDAKRKERAHNLRQMLRAHLMMERDVDYIVQEGKIVIIDENTGRPQPGRRFADGLHQAIEAKEGVSIQKETQTYATITLQNYFRMYEKLSGMTGTAMTEANEFKQIYQMDVLDIPTHKTCVRDDANDEIYMTEREKYNAILKEVSEVHEKGRPILIGTESVEISEKLARIFRQNKLSHTVLNAKHHAQEAEIISNAGQRSAITISTNMAGRGTDIKLGEGIAEIGGLHVIGTTRHQSRRIDRQLRGRCARQGDPGTSKFFVSFEDSLLRLFASPRLTGVLQKFRPPEGEPISASILNRSIETAQKRVEQRNYMIRKHTLEYDDVMNKQRQELYSFRNDILTTDNPEEIALELLENICFDAAEKHFATRSEANWTPEGYREWLIRHFPIYFSEDFFQGCTLSPEAYADKAFEHLKFSFLHKLEQENAKIPSTEEGFPPARAAHNAIRNLMIRKIDQRWQEHLLSMDHLRSDVSLRAVGQRDPLMEFKEEAFRMFGEFTEKIQEEITHDLFRFEIVPPDRQSLEQLLSQLQLETNRSLVSEIEEEKPAELPRTNGRPQAAEKLEPITAEETTGRNDPCPCGSGKKYKKCCGLLKQEVE